MNMYVKDTTCKLLKSHISKEMQGECGGLFKSNLGGGGHSKVILGVGGTQK